MNVQILLAIYNPNLNFFTKQLQSLNEQSYKNIEVICCDDGSTAPDNIRGTISDTLKDIKWHYIRNENNLGCNKTFEKLIKMGTAKYYAFCDQDDIWHKNKIEELMKMIRTTNSSLVYSDLRVINENDQIVASSLRSIRKRLNHLSGNDLWQHFVRMNSITGCTALVKSEIAKSALPFPGEDIYIWDQWLAIWASYKGSISYCPEPLVNYRIHDRNLVGVKKLEDIHDRQSYVEKKMDREINSLQFVVSRFNEDEKDSRILKRKIVEVCKRKKFLQKPSVSGVINCKRILFSDPLLFLFEFLIAISPRNGTTIIRLAKGSFY